MRTVQFLKLYSMVPSAPGVAAATRITCGKCGEFLDVVGGHNIDGAGFARIFARRGWRVGNVSKRHRCPQCVAGRTAEHSSAQQEGSTVPSLSLVEPRPPHPGASDQPPRELTREDRRLVIAKLEEVYLDEKHGYSAGWNDERVAGDLNCPRAWVEKLRDENFGPQLAPENPAIQRLTEQLAEAETQLGRAAGELKSIREAQARLELNITSVTQTVSSLEGKVHNIRADLKRLTGRP